MYMYANTFLYMHTEYMYTWMQLYRNINICTYVHTQSTNRIHNITYKCVVCAHIRMYVNTSSLMTPNACTIYTYMLSMYCTYVRTYWYIGMYCTYCTYVRTYYTYVRNIRTYVCTIHTYVCTVHTVQHKTVTKHSIW